ncbi:cysteine-rich CWC family protein [Rugamonas sp. CCM 8940]|uniref:cysteine-rich CWC family protein n=1 Tax=Rugamonas sp. CCM 8940 TaxID=2765359 RepID=UPI0018F36E00|nr:cysteine-rich CWC family protein [Rugamonas sp. CCM 8940]MBJ7309381.1 hypothetical protein [Rugamonas sp. CCM 8940]
MSLCARCGATFSCAMADPAPGADPAKLAEPCWCTYLPASLPVPAVPGSSCWCPDCLRRHIAASAEPARTRGSAAEPPPQT